jgi:hypothetical protein
MPSMLKLAPLSGVITLVLKHDRTPVRLRDDRQRQELARS